MATGFTAATSRDPLAEQLGVRNELDIGASFILHNELFLVGLGLKHLTTQTSPYTVIMMQICQ